jgi:predicted dehydrogenase
VPADPRPLRIGLLGAARIAPVALVRPARAVEGVELAAVAARDPERARRFAARHGIPRVHESYERLLADPELDAIYNPLPNSHHCAWTIRALEAGKHVLCEKPIAANAEEAARMAEAAQRSGRVLMEAFHWRYHPLAERLLEIVRSGELGRVRHVEARLCVPLLLPGDIRYRLDLAGGATMDTGCYTVHVVRTLAGAEPEVVRAEARLASPGVDRWMAAELRFPDGRTGRVECSLASLKLLAVGARVLGDEGELSVLNPIAPQLWHRLSVRSARGRRHERIRGDASYTGQLRAFRAAVREGAAFPTHPADAVANMRVIDAIYERAGLGRRGSPEVSPPRSP